MLVHSRVRKLSLVLAAIFAIGCGPIVMLPGGEISGTPREAPDDWGFTDEVDTVVLETRPSDPYSVNVWAVAAGDALYIAAGDSGNAWAKYVREDPRVRVKIREDVYTLRATPTTDAAEMAAFLAAAIAKYDFEPDEEQQAKAMLFRLEPR